MRKIPDNIRIAAPAARQKPAEELKNALAAYRIPTGVKHRTGIRTISEIQDDWLIVICTPETPKDPEILDAIDGFLKKGKREWILTLLAEGTPQSSFPESLLREETPDGTVIEHEPLAANITAETPAKSMKKLRVEKLRLLAPMLGVSFDDLMNRSRRRRNRILLTAGTAAVTASAVFLGLAVSRMQQTSAQEAALQAQYMQTKTARTEAETQAHQAKVRLGETIALQAQAILERNDTELALLLCLEFEEEMPESELLRTTFKNALQRFCAAGYVPVTTEKAYRRTRGMDRTLVDAGAYPPGNMYWKEEGAPALSYYETCLPEEPQDKTWINNDRQASMHLECFSKEYDYAVYTGKLKWADKEFDTGVWVRSLSDPEDGFWLRMPDGQLLHEAGKAAILQDGRLLVSEGNNLLCFDVQKREMVPCLDSNGETADELPFAVKTIWTDTPLQDKAVGLAEHGIAVFGTEPYRLLYIIRDEVTDSVVTADNANTWWRGTVIGALPDGEERILVGDRYVYDGENGHFLFKIDEQYSMSAIKLIEISAEGWIPMYKDHMIYMTDLKDGGIAAVIGETNTDREIYYGPVDEKTGQTSASLILTYTSNNAETEEKPRIFWEYRENATDVPDTTEAQIALARELLNGRELVPSERSRYHLD